MASAATCGLILLGNSGVGKSFLANRLLDDDKAFESKFSAKSVTHLTEWKEMQSNNGDHIYAVANIPGLIEADQRLVDANRHEIMKAFEQYPFSIVIFVFGHKNGRIPDEDLVAFMRINDAYEFSSKSLLLIVNGIPSDRPADYTTRTGHLLHQLTDVDIDHIYFIERLTSEESKRSIHQLLHEAVAKCEPSHHVKKQDIHLITDELVQLKGQCKQRQDQLLAQEEEEEYSKRQKTSLTPDAVEKLPSIQLRTSSMDTVEPMTDSIADQDKQFNEWLKSSEMKFKRSTSRIESKLHNPERDATIRLADHIKKDSERNKEMIAHIPGPTQVIHIKERKRDKVFRKLKGGKDYVLGSDESDPEPVHSPMHDYSEQGFHSNTGPSMPPHPYDPRSCKHDTK